MIKKSQMQLKLVLKYLNITLANNFHHKTFLTRHLNILISSRSKYTLKTNLIAYNFHFRQQIIHHDIRNKNGRARQMGNLHLKPFSVTKNSIISYP